MLLDQSHKGAAIPANMPYGELVSGAPPMSPRREAWARPADMTPHDEQGVCSQPCSSSEAKGAQRLREATSAHRDPPKHNDSAVPEGQDAREIFLATFCEHDESFRRQNCSEAAFGDSSSSGMANPNGFRPETSGRSQSQQFGITEMSINDESTRNVAPLPWTESLLDFGFNSMANSQSQTTTATKQEFRRQNLLDGDLRENTTHLSHQPTNVCSV